MKTAILIILLLTVLFLLFIAYFGAFRKIVVQIQEQGGEFVYYKDLVGDYRQSAGAMDESYYYLKDKGIDAQLGFGKYFDNPKKVEKVKLRSQAGCILEGADSMLKELELDSFKLGGIDKKEYIVAEFPYKGKLSVIFSIMRVYPKLNKFALDKGYSEDTPVIEIYDIPHKRILYRKEIAKQ